MRWENWSRGYGEGQCQVPVADTNTPVRSLCLPFLHRLHHTRARNTLPPFSLVGFRTHTHTGSTNPFISSCSNKRTIKLTMTKCFSLLPSTPTAWEHRRRRRQKSNHALGRVFLAQILTSIRLSGVHPPMQTTAHPKRDTDNRLSKQPTVTGG